MIVIGIPRALLYYIYFPLWRRFFSELGVKVVLSAPTSEEFLTAGARAVVDEVCAPVKIAMGHILSLAPHVDYVLVPRFVSVEPRAYICPKLMGLPDMIRHNGLKMPPVLAPDIDLSRGYLGLLRVLTEVSRVLGKGWWPSARAFYQALSEVKRTRRKLMTGLTPEEAFHGTMRRRKPGRRMRIAVLGHPYSIYDPLLSMNIIDRLRSHGIDVVTAEMLPEEHIALGLRRLKKKLFWTQSKMVLGAGLYFLHDDDDVEGIIVLSSFGCGLESLVADMLERFARRKEFPLLHLTVDEHSAEAGLVTRLEAFVETVRGRIRHARYLSPHGDAEFSNASAP
ncbi:MAG: hypothetical protein KGZ92_04425 [Firmicutes bacterium]|nr:hypothetical protein [Dethiobacter sp.]MBS3888530.1 hypothetical protein [Bacillota bacterium]